MNCENIEPKMTKRFESICKKDPFLESAINYLMEKIQFYHSNPNEYDMLEIQDCFFDILEELHIYTFEDGYMCGYDECLEDLEPNHELSFISFKERTKYRGKQEFKSKDVLEFIRNEIPDVFKALLKEYRKKTEAKQDD